MNKAILVLLLVLGSPLAFAGEGKGSCKSLAEKAAMSLFTLENSASQLSGTDVNVKLTNTASDSNQSQWQINFTNPKNEWAVIYKIDTSDYGDSSEEFCTIVKVDVIRAG